jgi:hypothetical protein
MAEQVSCRILRANLGINQAGHSVLQILYVRPDGTVGYEEIHATKYSIELSMIKAIADEPKFFDFGPGMRIENTSEPGQEVIVFEKFEPRGGRDDRLLTHGEEPYMELRVVKVRLRFPK